MMLAMVKDGGLNRGCFRKTAKIFSVSHPTMARLWRATTKNIEAYLSNLNVDENDNFKNEDVQQLKITIDLYPDIIFANKSVNKRGRPTLYDRSLLGVATKLVPKNERKTVRALAMRVSVSKTTIHRLMQEEGVFRRHVSKLKPTLTESNKVWRVMHALDQIDPISVSAPTRSNWKYKTMYDQIHIDEKWFLLIEEGAKYILVSDEEDPYRSVKHKSHITKVLFLCAQARPRYIEGTKTKWDGKLGIWPVGHWEPAKRGSANRPAGTLEWKNETVDKEKYTSLLINNLLPAIIEKWPRSKLEDDYSIIKIQQDGAKAHIAENDEFWLDALEEFNLLNKIELYTQPSNSPDCNLNDLGFFRALQSRYYERCPSNAGEIITLVEEEYEKFDCCIINKIWLSYQCVLNEIIENYGNNDYKLPHMQKDAVLKANNKLPRCLQVTEMAKNLYRDFVA